MTQSSIKYSISLKPAVMVEQVAKEGAVDFSRNGFEIEAERMEQKMNQEINKFIDSVKDEKDMDILVRKSAELAFLWVQEDDEVRAQRIENVLSLFEKNGHKDLLMFVAKGLIFNENSLEVIQASFASRVISEENKERLEELQAQMVGFNQDEEFDFLDKAEMEKVKAVQDELETFQDEANARIRIAIMDNYMFDKQIH